MYQSGTVLTMKRYFWITITAVIAAVALIIAATLLLYNQSLDRLKNRQYDQMLSAAHFLGQGTLQTFSADPAKLALYGRSSGCQRILVVDSTGLVRVSSLDYIEAGEEIMPYLVDSVAYSLSIRTKTAQFTAVHSIEGIPFISLYYPCYFDSEPFMLVIEADQVYFNAADQLRSAMVAAGLLGVIIVILLLLILRYVEIRARTAAGAARAHENLAFIGRMGAELAHELKNPLAIIKSSIDVLRRKYDPGRTEKPFTFLSDEVMRLSRVITDILSLSRDKALKSEFFEPLVPLTLLAEQLHAQYPGIIINCSVPDNLRISGDCDAFRQIAENLMRNAANALQGQGSITLSADCKGTACILSFCDNGPGIPSALAAKIFEPFVSGVGSGSGLGLAIVRNLCQRSGWRIELNNGQAHATAFYLYIPEGLWEQS